MNKDFIPIPIGNLKIDSIVNFDLYLPTPSGMILYRERHLDLTAREIERLMENKVQALYVSSLDMPNYYSYLINTGQSEKIVELDTKKEEIKLGIKDPRKISLYYKLHESYFPIKPQLILEGTTPPFKIYKVIEFRPISVCPMEGQDPRPVEKRDLDNLTGELVIKSEDVKKYYEYIQASTKEILKKEKSSPIAVVAIKESSKAIAMELMENPRSEKVLKSVQNEVAGLLKAVGENLGLINSMIRLGENDYYTFTHSVNVSMLCLGIGKFMGLKDSALFDLALGGFLHDIGKSEINRKILNNPNSFTPEQYKTMKDHVNLGIEIFRSHESLPEDSYYPLAMHHERFSGKGYPFGLKKDDIHLYGKIAGIADFYDAITTTRTYQNALTAFKALELMRKEKFRTEFDQDALKVLILLLGGKV